MNTIDIQEMRDEMRRVKRLAVMQSRREMRASVTYVIETADHDYAFKVTAKYVTLLVDGVQVSRARRDETPAPAPEAVAPEATPADPMDEIVHVANGGETWTLRQVMYGKFVSRTGACVRKRHLSKETRAEILARVYP